MVKNDYISRQAAIDDILRRLDTLKMTEFGTGTFRDGVADGYARIISDLESLPSARPEQRWIPVTEGLPREFTRVIGYMAWKAMTAIEYQHGRWYSIDHLEPLPDEAVTHWMPLPQPPKEGDE